MLKNNWKHIKALQVYVKIHHPYNSVIYVYSSLRSLLKFTQTLQVNTKKWHLLFLHVLYLSYQQLQLNLNT